MHDAQPIARRRQAVEHPPRAIGRSIVDDEDLARNGQIDGQEPVDDGADGGFFVVDRNDDRKKLWHARRH